MSDIEINQSNSTESALTAGNVMAEARRRQNLSLNDAAQHLKLGVKQLEALEAGEYDKLPGRTFVRGFIRNYAKLLQIDPEPLLNACPIETPQQLRSVETSKGEIRSSHTKQNVWVKYTAPLVILLVIVLSVMAFLKWNENKPGIKKSEKLVSSLPARPSAPTIPSNIDKSLPQIETPKSEPTQTPIQIPLPQIDTPLNTKPNETVLTEKSFTPAVPVINSATENLTSDSNQGLLQFWFDEEAWVEITDASNKVIFYQLNPAGSRRVVRGEPPFQVVIGNAAHVKMTYNNKPISLAPYIKIEVARLTLK